MTWIVFGLVAIAIGLVLTLRPGASAGASAGSP
jgi:hypothetical protein